MVHCPSAFLTVACGDLLEYVRQIATNRVSAVSIACPVALYYALISLSSG
jgi:hypothetical protein